MVQIEKLVRKNVLAMKPYSSARSEYKGKASVWLDANENPFDNGVNRYPDPLQKRLKETLARINKVDKNELFIGNGSDEAIDLLMRGFCEPNQDKIMYFTPGYGMYQVSADLNAVETIEIPLNYMFQLDMEQINPYLSDPKLKLIFICSPNNPTGNLIDLEDIKTLLYRFNGLVVVDEAYIQFSKQKSLCSWLQEFPQLVVLKTLSKSFGMAGLRVGMAFGNPYLIDILNKIKPPYNINCLSQEKALELLQRPEAIDEATDVLNWEREQMYIALQNIAIIDKVYPSEANFILFTSKKYKEIYEALVEQGIIIRDRNSQVGNSLRISIGTPEQNKLAIAILKSL